MLLEFSVSNFKSIRDTQSLNMLSSEKKANTIKQLMNNGNKFYGFKSVAIYGPNASGKSSLIDSMAVMKKIIKVSHIATSPLPYKPFKLSKENIKKPTCLEINFIVDGVRYQYGFSYSEEKIEGEWLYAYPLGRTQEWFVRKWDDEKKEHIYDFSDNFRGQKKIWQELTRKDQLFFSVANNRNSKQINPLYEWIDKNLFILSSTDGGYNILDDYSDSSLVTKFMQNADMGISNFSIEKEDVDVIKVVDIKSYHKDDDGRDIEFNFEEEESDGTKKIFAYSGLWLKSIKENITVVVDELDLHLHSRLLKTLFESFNSNKNEKSQLIATLHDTTVMSRDLFEKEQMWIIDKNKNNTELYSLAEFKGITIRENIQKKYMQGAYDGVPVTFDLFAQIDYEDNK